MHSEIMNDRLKGFPSHDHVDKSAVMIMTMIMIVTVIMMKTQALTVVQNGPNRKWKKLSLVR